LDSTIIQLILQDRKIAYAVTDSDLTVIEVSGPLVDSQNSHTNWLGHSLVELVPELAGSESALADILAGELPRFQLSWVNRETVQGSIAYLAMVELPYRDRTGNITGILHVVDDVTEMGRMEQQLTQQRNDLRLLSGQLNRQNLELAAANAELRRLDEIKSSFVSVAAHELRTPLSSITGFVELLLDEDYGALNKKQREYLEIVQRSAKRLLDITGNLLDVTRLETGRIELILQPLDLVVILEDVALEFRPQIEAKAQRLVLRAGPGLPLILADKMRTAQIISNLVSNASKYTPEGGIITLSLDRAADRNFLQITVADTGVGMDTADQARLFSRFFRAKTAVKTGATGTGLGLYITRCLVELHNGQIWFQSELNEGSEFYVTFPIHGVSNSDPRTGSPASVSTPVFTES
jgi:signal transduction histidine kinase